MGKKHAVMPVAGFGILLGKGCAYGGLVELEVEGVAPDWAEGFDWDALGQEIGKAVQGAIVKQFEAFAEGVKQNGH